MFIPSKTDLTSTLAAAEFNQITSELQTVQTSSGQTSSGTSLDQVAIAIARYAACNFYTDSGTADTYILTPEGSFKSPVDSVNGYFEGMVIKFRAGNPNTGAAIVNVNSAGVKDLKQADGTTALVAGDVPTTQDSIFRYNGTAFCLSSGSASTTAKGIIEIAANSEVAAAVDSVRAIVPSALASLFANSTLTAAGVIYIPVLLAGVFVKLMVQIKQGVNTTIGDSTQTITFPAAFPTAVLGCAVSTINTTASTNADAWFQEDSKTTSSIVVRAQWTGSGGVGGGVTPQIIAIGY